MSDFYTRLIKEHEELNVKFKKLGAFIGDPVTDEFKKLPTSEQGRLNRQFEIMLDYMDVLTERIEYLSATQVGDIKG